MGLIFTILGAVTAYNLWGYNTWLVVIAIIATLYQASSLNEMNRENQGLQSEDKAQSFINFISTIIIIALFVYSLF